MHASQISRNFYKWIGNKDRKAEIHSIFKSTVNILSDDGKFIPIVINDKPMSPFSIKLGTITDFKEMDIQIGEKIILTKDYLKGEKINIFYAHAEIWDDSINLTQNTVSLESLKLKLSIIKEYIREKGNKEGIFELMQIIPYDLYEGKEDNLDSSQLFIKDRFIKFIKAFTNNDIEEINILSKKIIGFGPGLTPSMDDFLSGMMISNLYISHCLKFNIEHAYKINHQIVNNIENKTTRVSEEMLKQSSIGETNEDIRNLMISIISFNNNGLKGLLDRVIKFGHSSGTDILCGIYIGSCILMQRYEANKHL